MKNEVKNMAIFTFVIVFNLALFNIAAANILTVPNDYTKIQDAIDASADGDTVIVKAGTYRENINFSGKAISVKSEIGAPLSIINGGGMGTVVTFDSAEKSSSVLDGFTITNGSEVDGGGIYCEVSSPVIKNCVISGNTVTGEGGGINCYKASPEIIGCVISGNTANVQGGGINCTINSKPKITNCVISGNSVINSTKYNGHGGGIACWNASPVITNCKINGNTANAFGGGMALYLSTSTITDSEICSNVNKLDGAGIALYAASPTFTNCRISNNRTASTAEGGGITCNEASPKLNNCVITENVAGVGAGIACYKSAAQINNCTVMGNKAAFQGGGLNLDIKTTASISNCIIAKNSVSHGSGGGVALWRATPTLANCTIIENTASGFGGGIFANWNSDGAKMVNSIVWANRAKGRLNSIYGKFQITYSDVQTFTGVLAGEGNINKKPAFVGSGDYHLRNYSPCIDAGTDDVAAYPALPANDYDNEARPQDGNKDGIAKRDIGADEYIIQ